VDIVKNNNKVVLFGASGHGSVVADLLEESGEYNILFWDDNTKKQIPGYDVYTPRDVSGLESYIITIGDNKIRKKCAVHLESQGANFLEAAVHPKAVLARGVTIDKGSVLMALSVINRGVKIGKHCIINTAASVDHDCILEDYVHVSPNATLAGGVYVAEGAWIGAGAVVIHGVKIGEWSVIGAGCVVVKDVEAGTIVVGNPQRIINKRLI
jgi:sugar O-acyltransferase (sialic acid O-acetyltransferase NeuD family)